MLEHTVFVFYILIIFISTIGYGYLFSKIIYNDFASLNFGYLGIIGFFFLCLISQFSTFFSPHNYLHNLIIHSIGVFTFILLFLSRKSESLQESKKFLVLLLILFIGVYVYKNHDDFPYYHLTYALNLSENKLIIGTGIFSHGFRTLSSLFYFHSLLYLPLIKYYLFHIGPFLILIFFNYILITKLIEKYHKSQFDISYFLTLLNFTFVNVVFYRIGEHGVDRSGQVLLFLAFIIFCELFFFKKDKNEKNVLFNFFLVSIFLASSTKVLFLIYLIFAAILFFKDKFYKEYLVKKNIFIILILISSFSVNLTQSFLSTGCFVYPEKKTCISNLDWSMPTETVYEKKLYLEWWAKAGGGPGYSSEIKKDVYIKNFIWVKDWVERHFFNKISDTVSGIIFISLLTFILFKTKKKKNFFSRNTFLIYSILFLLFLEWFLSHPAMRYGGFVLWALPFFIFTSLKIEKYDLSKKKVFFSTVLIIVLTFVTYNLRNVQRLHKEINFYKYNLAKSPFFYVKEMKSEITYEDGEFKLYTPPSGQMCWALKTPCSYRRNHIVKSFLGTKIIVGNY